MKEKSKTNNNSWVIVIAITTFILSLLFSFLSNTAISKLNILARINSTYISNFNWCNV